MKKPDFLKKLLLLFVFLSGCATAPVSQAPQKAAAPQAVTAPKPGENVDTLSPALSDPSIKVVGFDIDDTILFSSPAFDKGYASAQPYTEDFWRIVNTSDRAVSKFKPKTVKILKAHLAKGQQVYLITARNPAGGGALKKFLSEKLGIPEDHVLFAPSGKTELMKKLGINAFYGDSDSDMRYAKAAGAMPLRIERSPQSGYKSSYNPGSLGEYVIPDSE